MRRAEQRHSPRQIAKDPELSELLPQLGPQFGTISMKDDRGKKAEFAHANPTTWAKESILPPWRQKYVEDVKAARSVRGCDRVPMKKQDQGGKSPLGQHCCPIAAPLSRVEARPVSC